MVWWHMFWMWRWVERVMNSVQKRPWWRKLKRANVLTLGMNGFRKWMNRSEFANKLGFQYYSWESHFFLVLCIIDAVDVVIPSLYVIVCWTFSIRSNTILVFALFHIMEFLYFLKWSLHFIHSSPFLFLWGAGMQQVCIWGLLLVLWLRVLLELMEQKHCFLFRGDHQEINNALASVSICLWFWH